MTASDSLGWPFFFFEGFQSQGPTKHDIPISRPDITAPEVLSTLTNAPIPFAGTSAATPVVGGVAALLKEVKPDVTANEIESALSLSLAVDIAPPIFADNIWGFGHLELGASPPFPWNPADTDSDGIPDVADNHCAGFATQTSSFSLSPIVGPPGRLVGIEGLGFGSNAVAFVGSTPAQTFDVAGETGVTFDVPSVPDGHYLVRVENPEGCRSLEEIVFEVDSGSPPTCGLVGVEPLIPLSLVWFAKRRALRTRRLLQ